MLSKFYLVDRHISDFKNYIRYPHPHVENVLQEITVHPPIDKSRAILTNHLNGYVGTICGLNTLQSTRYTVGIEVAAGDTTHRGLLTGKELRSRESVSHA